MILEKRRWVLFFFVLRGEILERKKDPKEGVNKTFSIIEKIILYNDDANFPFINNIKLADLIL